MSSNKTIVMTGTLSVLNGAAKHQAGGAKLEDSAVAGGSIARKERGIDMGELAAVATSRWIQPTGHVLSQEQRHQQMKQREDKFARMLADMQKKRDKGK